MFIDWWKCLMLIKVLLCAKIYDTIWSVTWAIIGTAYVSSNMDCLLSSDGLPMILSSLHGLEWKAVDVVVIHSLCCTWLIICLMASCLFIQYSHFSLIFAFIYLILQVQEIQGRKLYCCTRSCSLYSKYVKQQTVMCPEAYVCYR